MISLLVFIEDSRVSGPLVQLVNLLRALPEEVEVHVFCSKSGCGYIGKLDENMTVHEFNVPYIRKMKNLRELSSLISSVKKIRMASKGRFVILNFFGTSSLLPLLVSIICKIDYYFRVNDNIKNSIYQLVTRLHFRFSKFVVFNSNSTKDIYANVIGKKPNKVIHSGIKIFSGNTGFDERRIVYTVANVNPLKNIELLIHTARNNPEYEFHCIGPVYKTQKRYYEKIEKMVDNENVGNIRFLGFVDNPHEEYKGAIYFCTSLSEASPNSVFESMAHGNPVLFTDVSDLKAFNQSYNFGACVPFVYDDSVELALNFLKCNYTELSHNAKRCVLSELSIDNVAKSWEGIL